MPQDWFNQKYIAEKLNEQLAGAKLNRVSQPKKDEILLSLYAKNENKKLVVSANAGECGIYYTTAEKENPAVPYNFCMLLRKHLTSCTLEKVSQTPFERITVLHFVGKNELFERTEKSLIVEIMGKYSNVILTENDKILGALKTVASDLTSKRPLIVGMKYVLPPSQEKLELKKDNLLKLYRDFSLSGSTDDNVKFLFDNVKGLAYQTAEELWRKVELKLNDSTENCEKIIAETIIDGVENARVMPTMYYDGEKVVDFSCVPYENYYRKQVYYKSLTDLVSDFYEKKQFFNHFNEKKNKLVSATNSAHKKSKKRLGIILEREQSCLDMEDNKIKGELLTTYAYMIKGGESVEVDNYYTNEKLKISLDKNLSAIENANAYFKKYKKQKRTLSLVEAQKAETESEVEYFNGILTDLSLAETFDDLNAVEEELKHVGIVKESVSSKNKRDKAKYRNFTIDGFTVKVGRNNIENESLTQGANKNDVWLHAKSMHSAHVVISCARKSVTEKVIKTSAEICAYYSGGRYSQKIEVDYTFKKNLKKPPKSKAGYFIYTDYKTVIVNPDRHAELQS